MDKASTLKKVFMLDEVSVLGERATLAEAAAQ